MFKRLIISILVAISLLASACNNAGESTDANASETATAGNSENIITLHPTLTEVVYALGGEDNIVATDLSSKYPAAAEALPKVGYHRMLDAEKLLKHEPGLLLISSESGPETALEQVREAGVKTETIDPPLDINKVPTFITSVGQAIGKADQAQSVSDAVKTKIEAVKAKADGQTDKPRVLCVYDRGGVDRMYLIGKKTAPFAMVAAAGGQPALDFEGHKSITSEAVIASDPDILLLPESTLEAIGGVKALRAHAILGQTKAAKNGRVITLPSPVFFGLGAHTGDTLEKLYTDFFDEVQS